MTAICWFDENNSKLSIRPKRMKPPTNTRQLKQFLTMCGPFLPRRMAEKISYPRATQQTRGSPIQRGLVLGKGRRYSFYGGERNAEVRSSSLLPRLYKTLPPIYRRKRSTIRRYSGTRRKPHCWQRQKCSGIHFINAIIERVHQVLGDNLRTLDLQESSILQQCADPSSKSKITAICGIDETN